MVEFICHVQIDFRKLLKRYVEKETPKEIEGRDSEEVENEDF
jgi:hypothetical protein